MNNQPGFDGNLKQFMNRLFNLGLKRGEVPPGSPGSFQHEAWIRRMLKEKASRRADLQTRLEDVLFIVLDTETTGFRPEHGDQIFSVAAARIQNRSVIGEFRSLINPGIEIPKEISLLTGITTKDVKEAPALDEKAEEILGFLSGGIVIGYHISHDYAFLNHYLWRRYRSSLKQPALELALLTERLTGEGPFPSLDSAADYFNIPCQNRHQADADVKIMSSLLMNLLRLCIEKGIETLEDLYIHIK
ncbi:exonuclease domain-containing protein [Fictibacillus enclensis]|uniref:exonuclease domain-containing protein n=1 Tax=Fictibacillus TaxID=1329200 RepID=UPI00101337B6|nr:MULTISPECIES: exonuclease domain-containing protein [Fictibacillus]MDM5338288.1 exonuclease domain-containing protein [Fictibacillus enclensis]RXY99067.1 DNA polymerase III subunit epsilon [Fictibacillus sp. S7]